VATEEELAIWDRLARPATLCSLLVEGYDFGPIERLLLAGACAIKMT
jgi:hypothetical protein